MQPFPTSKFKKPEAVATVMSNAFLLFARNVGLNDRILAMGALRHTRQNIEQNAGHLPTNDFAAVKGMFDLIEAALGPEKTKQ